MPSKKSKRSKREIRQMQLEAERVIMSKWLYQWSLEYGYDYMIFVWNAPGEVFVRLDVEDDRAEEMLDALEKAAARLRKGLARKAAEHCGICGNVSCAHPAVSDTGFVNHDRK